MEKLTDGELRLMEVLWDLLPDRNRRTRRRQLMRPASPPPSSGGGWS